MNRIPEELISPLTLSHMHINVQDRDVSADYYKDNLGFKFHRNIDDLALTDRPRTFVRGAGGFSLAIETDPIADRLTHAIKFGFAPAGAVAAALGRSAALFNSDLRTIDEAYGLDEVRDPDDHAILVMKPLGETFANQPLELTFFEIAVQETQSVAQFYSDVFGYTMLATDIDHALLRGPDGFVFHLRRSELESLPKWFHFGFRAPTRQHVWEIAQQFSASGFRIFQEFKELDDYVSITIEDPEGRNVEVYWDEMEQG